MKAAIIALLLTTATFCIVRPEKEVNFVETKEALEDSIPSTPYYEHSCGESPDDIWVNSFSEDSLRIGGQDEN